MVSKNLLMSYGRCTSVGEEENFATIHRHVKGCEGLGSTLRNVDPGTTKQYRSTQVCLYKFPGTVGSQQKTKSILTLFKTITNV